MGIQKHGLTSSGTPQCKGREFSVPPYQWVFLLLGERKNWNLKKSVPGQCTVLYTGPVTVVSGFCMMTTKLVWLLPIIQW